MLVIGAAGGAGERVVHEPRVPRGPTTRSERSERRDRWGGCGEGTAPGVGAPGEAKPSRRQDPLRMTSVDDRVDIA
jgi:hypothetical protein